MYDILFGTKKFEVAANDAQKIKTVIVAPFYQGDHDGK
jgi:hypothetical protein